MLGDLRGSQLNDDPAMLSKYRISRFAVGSADLKEQDRQDFFSNRQLIPWGEKLILPRDCFPIRIRPQLGRFMRSLREDPFRKADKAERLASSYTVIPKEEYPYLQIIRNGLLGSQSILESISRDEFNREIVSLKNNCLEIRAKRQGLIVEFPDSGQNPELALPKDLLAKTEKHSSGMQIVPRPMSEIIARLESWVHLSRTGKVDDCVASYVTALTMVGPDLHYNAGRFSFEMSTKEHKHLQLEISQGMLSFLSYSRRNSDIQLKREGFKRTPSYRQQLDCPLFDILLTRIDREKYPDQLHPFILNFVVSDYAEQKINLSGLNEELVGVRFISHSQALESNELRSRLQIRDSQTKNLIKPDRRKLIVLDADQTLWDGSIDSNDVSFSPARRRFLTELAKIKNESGLQLAVLSHNQKEPLLKNLAKLSAIADLPVSDFVTICATGDYAFQSKSTVMDILLDQTGRHPSELVFMDDDPIERTAMQQIHPEIYTPELNISAEDWLPALTASGVLLFDKSPHQISVRDGFADRESKRVSGISKTQNETEFLKNLAIETRLFGGNGYQKWVERADQLFERTNQFNLTREPLNDFDYYGDDTLKYYFTYLDRFGDEGLIGFAHVTRAEDGSATINNLALSCRVLHNRNLHGVPAVPQSFLSGILKHLRKNLQIKDVFCRYRQTDRNHLVPLVLKSLGFAKVAAEEQIEVHQLIDYDSQLHAELNSLIVQNTGIKVRD